ncbi:glycoside hydrolase family 25 protein [Botryobacter ruber]|uniref:glycoside hydrolase family 25 protein n=1 Tax=Botryobacter ruber TaxID=2171629 RepID=UPI000E0B8690|nr:GH25 family lysozyme [Botryobacter ruber]
MAKQDSRIPKTAKPIRKSTLRKSGRKKKRTRSLWPLALFFFFAVLAIATYGIYRKLNPVWYNIDKREFPISGIDVSKHSGKIDWLKVSRQQIDFAYIKSTEGVSYLDPKYKVNYEGAKEHGLKTGVYHFFRFNKPGKEQADNFLKHSSIREEDLPPVIDVEDWGNKNHRKTRLEITGEIRQFIELVEKRTGREVVIYTNESSYKSYIEGHFDSNLIWICTFRKKPLLEQDMWVFWQHAHDKRLDGVEGYVDWNTFNGGAEDWMHFARKQVPGL